MRKQTIISMVVTIVLFVAAIILIALGINSMRIPLTYHTGYGYFHYEVRYVSSSLYGANIFFQLGKAALISSFVMLGFTLYLSTKKKDDDVKFDCKREERTERKEKEGALDAEIKEEIKRDE